jgi:sigma-B regulation protein RsbU (phosphoserine phosphatase)
MIQGLREWQRIKAIEMELEKGRAIQQDFLPAQIPCPPQWDIATCFHPAREVSGDFYDVFNLPGGNLGLVIADVCDKGVGSALYMALIRSLIRVYAEQALYVDNEDDAVTAGKNTGTGSIDVAKGLSAVIKTNAYLAKNHSQEGMFATLFFGILSPKTGQLIYYNCGHEPLYVVGCDGLKSELFPTGPAVGVMEEVDYQVGTLYINPGELLLGLTDGVTEARNTAGELFTRKRLKSLLAQPAKSAGGLLEQIRQQLFTFVGTAPDADDVTMLAVRRLV